MNYIIVFFISMVPLIELRGSILYATGVGLPFLPAYITAIIGNMLPVPVIFLFARRILIWGSDKPVIGRFFSFCLEKGEKGGKKLQAKAGRGLFVALLLFVGIPLPGTGAWTGTLAASLLDMDFKSSVTAVMCGVLLAGIIMRCGRRFIWSDWCIIWLEISNEREERANDKHVVNRRAGEYNGTGRPGICFCYDLSAACQVQ